MYSERSNTTSIQKNEYPLKEMLTNQEKQKETTNVLPLEIVSSQILSVEEQKPQTKFTKTNLVNEKVQVNQSYQLTSKTQSILMSTTDELIQDSSMNFGIHKNYLTSQDDTPETKKVFFDGQDIRTQEKKIKNSNTRFTFSVGTIPLKTSNLFIQLHLKGQNCKIFEMKQLNQSEEIYSIHCDLFQEELEGSIEYKFFTKEQSRDILQTQTGLIKRNFQDLEKFAFGNEFYIYDIPQFNNTSKRSKQNNNSYNDNFIWKVFQGFLEEHSLKQTRKILNVAIQQIHEPKYLEIFCKQSNILQQILNERYNEFPNETIQLFTYIDEMFLVKNAGTILELYCEQDDGLLQKVILTVFKKLTCPKDKNEVLKTLLDFAEQKKRNINSFEKEIKEFLNIPKQLINEKQTFEDIIDHLKLKTQCEYSNEIITNLIETEIQYLIESSNKENIGIIILKYRDDITKNIKLQEQSSKKLLSLIEKNEYISLEKTGILKDIEDIENILKLEQDNTSKLIHNQLSALKTNKELINQIKIFEKYFKQNPILRKETLSLLLNNISFHEKEIINNNYFFKMFTKDLDFTEEDMLTLFSKIIEKSSNLKYSIKCCDQFQIDLCSIPSGQFAEMIQSVFDSENKTFNIDQMAENLILVPFSNSVSIFEKVFRKLLTNADLLSQNIRIVFEMKDKIMKSLESIQKKQDEVIKYDSKRMFIENYKKNQFDIKKTSDIFKNILEEYFNSLGLEYIFDNSLDFDSQRIYKEDLQLFKKHIQNLVQKENLRNCVLLYCKEFKIVPNSFTPFINSIIFKKITTKIEKSQFCLEFLREPFIQDIIGKRNNKIFRFVEKTIFKEQDNFKSYTESEISSISEKTMIDTLKYFLNKENKCVYEKIIKMNQHLKDFQQCSSFVIEFTEYLKIGIIHEQNQYESIQRILDAYNKNNLKVVQDFISKIKTTNLTNHILDVIKKTIIAKKLDKSINTVVSALLQNIIDLNDLLLKKQFQWFDKQKAELQKFRFYVENVDNNLMFFNFPEKFSLSYILKFFDQSSCQIYQNLEEYLKQFGGNHEIDYEIKTNLAKLFYKENEASFNMASQLFETRSGSSQNDPQSNFENKAESSHQQHSAATEEKIGLFKSKNDKLLDFIRKKSKQKINEMEKDQIDSLIELFTIKNFNENFKNYIDSKEIIILAQKIIQKEGSFLDFRHLNPTNIEQSYLSFLFEFNELFVEIAKYHTQFQADKYIAISKVITHVNNIINKGLEKLKIEWSLQQKYEKWRLLITDFSILSRLVDNLDPINNTMQQFTQFINGNILMTQDNSRVLLRITTDQNSFDEIQIQSCIDFLHQNCDVSDVNDESISGQPVVSNQGSIKNNYKSKYSPQVKVMFDKLEIIRNLQNFGFLHLEELIAKENIPFSQLNETQLKNLSSQLDNWKEDLNKAMKQYPMLTLVGYKHYNTIKRVLLKDTPDKQLKEQIDEICNLTGINILILSQRVCYDSSEKRFSQNPLQTLGNLFKNDQPSDISIQSLQPNLSNQSFSKANKIILCEEISKEQMSKFQQLERCLNVEFISSTQSGYGKSFYIDNQCRKLGTNKIRVTTNGESNKESIIKQLYSQMNEQSQKENRYSYHIDLYENNILELNFLLFELILLRSINLNSTSIVKIDEKEKIFIEVSNSYKQFFKSKIELSTYFKDVEIKFNPIKDFEVISSNYLDKQIPWTAIEYLSKIFLKGGEEEQSQKIKILISRILQKINEKNRGLKQSNLNYYQLINFMKVFGQQMLRLEENPSSKDILNHPTISEQVIQLLLDYSLYLSKTHIYGEQLQADEDEVYNFEDELNYLTDQVESSSKFNKKKMDFIISSPLNSLFVFFQNTSKHKKLNSQTLKNTYNNQILTYSTEEKISQEQLEREALIFLGNDCKLKQLKSDSFEQNKIGTTLFRKALNTFITSPVKSLSTLCQKRKINDLQMDNSVLELSKDYIQETTTEQKNETDSFKNIFSVEYNYKLYSLVIRLQAGIPIIIMGDAGMGKSHLINYLGTNLKCKYLRIIIHEGVKENEIYNMVNQINSGLSQEKYIIFFDEINTNKYLSTLFKEILIDRCLKGVPIRSNILFIAAMNPYSKKCKQQQDLMNAQIHVGIRKDYESQKQCQLEFVVCPIHESLKSYIWNFSQISDNCEETIIFQMIKESMLKLKVSRPSLSNTLSTELNNLSTVVLKSHQTIREILGVSSCSLRDIKRFCQLLEKIPQFLDHCEEEVKLIEEPETKIERVKQAMSNMRFPKFSHKDLLAIYISLYIAYYVRIPYAKDRKLYLQYLASTMLFKPWKKIQDAKEKIQTYLLKEIVIGQKKKGIAQSKILKENIFILFICIVYKIPVCLIGQPGSSKSLSIQLLIQAMKGQYSKSYLLKHYPTLTKQYYQGNIQCMAEDIEKIFKEAEECQEQSEKENQNNLNVVYIDEIGLAEISPHNPLKVLHQTLEREKVAVACISNWPLDSSKMNRMLAFYCLDQDEEDLSEIVTSIKQQICKEKFEEIDQKKYRELLHEVDLVETQFAKIYLSYLESMKDTTYSKFHGLRDYFSWVKHFYTQVCEYLQEYNEDNKFSAKSNLGSNFQQNFSGLESNQHIIELQNKFQTEIKIPQIYDPLIFIKKNIIEESQTFETRNLIIITDSIMLAKEKLMKMFEKNENEKVKVIVISGSGFDDQNSEKGSMKVIYKIIECVKKGVKIILYNFKSIYQNLYELLDLNYETIMNKTYCKITYQSKQSSVEVHPDFKCILLVDQDEVQSLDGPLLNRFEKHLLLKQHLLCDKNDQENILKLHNILSEHPFPMHKITNPEEIKLSLYFQCKALKKRDLRHAEELKITKQDLNIVNQKLFNLVNFYQVVERDRNFQEYQNAYINRMTSLKIFLECRDSSYLYSSKRQKFEVQLFQIYTQDTFDFIPQEYKSISLSKIESSGKLESEIVDFFKINSYYSFDQCKNTLLLLSDITNEGKDSFNKLDFTVNYISHVVNKYRRQLIKENSFNNQEFRIVLVIRVEPEFRMVPVSGDWQNYYLDNISPEDSFFGQVKEKHLFQKSLQRINISFILAHQKEQIELDSLIGLLINSNNTFFETVVRKQQYEEDQSINHPQYLIKKIDQLKLLYQNQSKTVNQLISEILMKIISIKNEQISYKDFTELIKQNKQSISTTNFYYNFIQQMREFILQATCLLFRYLEENKSVKQFAHCNIEDQDRDEITDAIKKSSKNNQEKLQYSLDLNYRKSIDINHKLKEKFLTLTQLYSQNFKILKNYITTVVDTNQDENKLIEDQTLKIEEDFNLLNPQYRQEINYLFVNLLIDSRLNHSRYNESFLLRQYMNLRISREFKVLFDIVELFASTTKLILNAEEEYIFEAYNIKDLFNGYVENLQNDVVMNEKELFQVIIKNICEAVTQPLICDGSREKIQISIVNSISILTKIKQNTQHKDSTYFHLTDQIAMIPFYNTLTFMEHIQSSLEKPNIIQYGSREKMQIGITHSKSILTETSLFPQSKNSIYNNLIDQLAKIPFQNAFIFMENVKSLLQKILKSNANSYKIFHLDYEKIIVLKSLFEAVMIVNWKEDYQEMNKEVVKTKESLQNWYNFIETLIWSMVQQGYYRVIDINLLMNLLNLEQVDKEINKTETASLKFQVFAKKIIAIILKQYGFKNARCFFTNDFNNHYQLLQEKEGTNKQYSLFSHTLLIFSEQLSVMENKSMFLDLCGVNYSNLRNPIQQAIYLAITDFKNLQIESGVKAQIREHFKHQQGFNKSYNESYLISQEKMIEEKFKVDKILFVKEVMPNLIKVHQRLFQSFNGTVSQEDLKKSSYLSKLDSKDKAFIQNDFIESWNKIMDKMSLENKNTVFYEKSDKLPMQNLVYSDHRYTKIVKEMLESMIEDHNQITSELEDIIQQKIRDNTGSKILFEQILTSHKEQLQRVSINSYNNELNSLNAVEIFSTYEEFIPYDVKYSQNGNNNNNSFNVAENEYFLLEIFKSMLKLSITIVFCENDKFRVY